MISIPSCLFDGAKLLRHKFLDCFPMATEEHAFQNACIVLVHLVAFQNSLRPHECINIRAFARNQVAIQDRQICCVILSHAVHLVAVIFLTGEFKPSNKPPANSHRNGPQSPEQQTQTRVSLSQLFLFAGHATGVFLGRRRYYHCQKGGVG